MAIDRRLAACAQISAPLTALYHWNGRCETSEEVLVSFKTNLATLAKLRALVEQNHPYELPEFIWFPAGASSRYANWVHANAIDR
jgi:periplasmic divalent cation tolerance protein